MIKHFPICDIKKATRFYTEKDGVPVSYVCTTDIDTSDIPMDIFYRESPHPEFGNHYFALYFKPNNTLIIANADKVETLTFGMVEDDNGNLQYSRSHHDYKSFKNGNMIDGGRSYTRYGGKIYYYTIKDGKMIKDVS